MNKNEHDKYIKLGISNKSCIENMTSWCKHAEIKHVASGIYAQMTGLPIGSYSLSCSQVPGAIEGMNLQWMFTDYIETHCQNCTVHEANGSTEWAEKIIRSKHIRDQEHKENEKRHQDQLTGLLKNLENESKSISTKAAPESKNICNFLEQFFSGSLEKQSEMAERLLQSAKIASELYPPSSIDLIMFLCQSHEFASYFIPIARELIANKIELAKNFHAIAINNIENCFEIESSASLLETSKNLSIYPLPQKQIENLLTFQNYDRPVGGWINKKPDYPNAISVLLSCYDASPKNFTNCVKQILENGTEFQQFQTLGSLIALKTKNQALNDDLVNSIIYSFEKDESETDSLCQSVSSRAVSLLSLLFSDKPDEVDQSLTSSFDKSDLQHQKQIIRIYRDQFFSSDESFDERIKHKRREKISLAEEVAIKRLLEWTQNDKLDLEVRNESVESLSMASSYASVGMINHLNLLFGYYVIISSQSEPPAPPPKIMLPGDFEDTKLNNLDKVHRNHLWLQFKNYIHSCLKKLAEQQSNFIFPYLNGIFTTGWDSADDSVKEACLAMLGELESEYKIKNSLLPFLWKGIMDTKSQLVRTRAIDATMELFSGLNPPPSNLVDTIILHLTDPYVIVHKMARRAITCRYHWLDTTQAKQALLYLSNHVKVYKNTKYELSEICKAIINLSKKHSELQIIAFKIVARQFPTNEMYVDKEIVESMIDLTRYCDHLDRYVTIYIAKYLEIYERDRHNHYSYSERSDMFKWLHSIPSKTLLECSSVLLESSLKLAIRDTWESLHFASLFSSIEQYALERQVLSTALESLPDEPRNQHFRSDLKCLIESSIRNDDQTKNA